MGSRDDWDEWEASGSIETALASYADRSPLEIEAEPSVRISMGDGFLDVPLPPKPPVARDMPARSAITIPPPIVDDPPERATPPEQEVTDKEHRDGATPDGSLGHMLEA